MTRFYGKNLSGGATFGFVGKIFNVANKYEKLDQIAHFGNSEAFPKILIIIYSKRNRHACADGA